MAQFDLELPEIPEEPSNADLAGLMKVAFEATKSTHECLEQHRKTTEAGYIVLSSQIKQNADSTTKLLKITEENCKSIKTIAVSARAISRATKDINKKADNAVTTAGTAALKAKEASDDAASAAISGTNANKKLDDLNRNAWRFVLTLAGGLLLAGFIGVFTLAYQAATNHTTTVAAVQAATNTVVRSIP